MMRKCSGSTYRRWLVGPNQARWTSLHSCLFDKTLELQGRGRKPWEEENRKAVRLVSKEQTQNEGAT